MLLKLLNRIPEHLSERTRILTSPTIKSSSFVLYWMRTAARGHENPALDVAIEIGNLLGQPVFVYHGLSERYPYASDRHHQFILEGALDVQQELRERNIGYGFHFERPGHRGPVLKQLATMASLIITEDMPTDPMRHWTMAIAKSVPVPILRVDTACIVPMAKLSRCYQRAMSYREATKVLREERIQTQWFEAVSEHPNFQPELPFVPYHLKKSLFESDIASCQIDHSVAPVPETKGGSTAGYKRWAHFKLTALRKYHRTRNNPNAKGVSRMSAYLHYGHVSPFRIAREAAAQGTPGAEKYLDELLIWRELAYLWCDHHTNLDSWSHIPDWAKQTLMTASEENIEHYNYEQLHRAKTADELWNACQQSLLIHGELHNNLRMTWGKQLIPWAPSPQQAHRWAIDLNHRYALDGRDPASYGGLLWCFGLFDRVFKPAQAGFGNVRPRTTETHQKRLNVEAYKSHITRDRNPDSPNVAIIGAGIAGLSCARVLQDHGLNVHVFDKGRTPGGRMSTRRSRDDNNWVIDHGVSGFFCSDKRFLLRVKSWEQHGVVQQWQAPIGRLTAGGSFVVDSETPTYYTGSPCMSALPLHLASDLMVQTETQINKTQRHQNKWRLFSNNSEQAHGPFDELVITAPPVQTRALLPSRLKLKWLDEKVMMKGCITIMLELSHPLGIEWGMARCEHPKLSVLIQESSKPNRPESTQWVLHAMGDWAQANLDTPPKELQDDLIDAFFALVGQHAEVKRAQAHRWRYALSSGSDEMTSYRDAAECLSFCGDWLSRSNSSVEGAYLSGVAAAGRILGQR